MRPAPRRAGSFGGGDQILIRKRLPSLYIEGRAFEIIECAKRKSSTELTTQVAWHEKLRSLWPEREHVIHLWVLKRSFDGTKVVRDDS